VEVSRGDELLLVGVEPTVGVVIPAYNAATFLGEMLESLLAQPYRPIDVVVVDDGSTDATRAVADGYVADHAAARLQVVAQARGGPGAARNRGVALVRGDLIAFHDADDLCTPKCLALCVALLRARPEVDAVFGMECRFSVVDRSGPVPLGEARAGYRAGAMVIRRAAFERVGPFNPRFRFAEGLDWFVRAQEAGLRTVTVPDQLRWRRAHAANLSRNYHRDPTEPASVLKASLDRRRSGAA
jgi:glycosyltransferase involved in cell wall biosynthesis